MLEIIVLPLLTMVTCKETRAAIIALHKNGFTGKDIVATKIAPKSTIYRFIKNFKERGSILVKKASGRPRKSSKRQDRLLKRIQLRDRSATSAELAQEWQQAGVSASARTVRRRLLEDGLVSRRAAKKPLLSKKNIRDRLIFCRKYSEWTDGSAHLFFSGQAFFPDAPNNRKGASSENMTLPQSSAVHSLYFLQKINLSLMFFWREVASLLPFLTPGHLPKVFASLCMQMCSHLPAAIPEQALHWWHSDPAAEFSLGDDPGACWTFLDALKPSLQELNLFP
uniref:Transposase Tc1-like domain-containing protein n=1 Tax=Cyprinus carpio carpio TaxID=630221 RepID=A0A9J8CIM4_CYPCA